MITKKIHEPYDSFKGWLRGNGVVYADIARLIGVNVATVSMKINGQSDFSLSEIQKIKDTYNLDSEIFFTDDVA